MTQILVLHRAMSLDFMNISCSRSELMDLLKSSEARNLSNYWRDLPNEPYVSKTKRIFRSKTRGTNLAPMALAVSEYLMFLVFFLCWAKCLCLIMAGVVFWFDEGLGCIIVMSAR